MAEQNQDLPYFGKTFREVCEETIESRKQPQHIISLAERVSRINELKEKFGFTSKDNSAKYHQKLAQNKHAQTARKASDLSKKVAMFHQLVKSAEAV